MQFDKCNLCFVHMFSESFFFFLHLADVGSLLDNVGFDHLSLDEVESADFIDTLFFCKCISPARSGASAGY